MAEKKYIKRDLYYKKIEPYIGGSLIKVLTGQRRSGKSFILFQVMDMIKEHDPYANIIYINKEDYSFDSIQNYRDLILYVESNTKRTAKNYLFIDEIQDILKFEKALRHFQTTGDYDIYCTGSNASLLSGELATYLAGRYIQIKVHTLAYNEFLVFHNLEDSNENLLKYIQIGGMPHMINLRDEKRIYYEYLENVFDSIVLRDIVARFNIRNVSLLQDLVRFLADNTGSIISAKRISDYLKSQKINIQSKTILEYLSYLENVFLVKRVKRSNIEGRKIFEYGEKFYFEDLGIRHIVIPYQIKDINKILENLVHNHLLAYGYNINIGTQGNKEIDFIAEKNGKRHYFQVAYLIADEKTHKREFGNLLDIKDNLPKTVITMDELAGEEYKGIRHLHIRSFLTDFEG